MDREKANEIQDHKVKALRMDPLQREYPTIKVKTVNVVTTPVQGRYPLPNFYELANGRIIGLWVRQRDTGNNGRANNGGNLVNDNALLQARISLQTKDGREMINAPLLFFASQTTENKPYTQIFIDENLDPSECYITFANDGNAVVADEVVELTFVYDDSENC